MTEGRCIAQFYTAKNSIPVLGLILIGYYGWPLDNSNLAGFSSNRGPDIPGFDSFFFIRIPDIRNMALKFEHQFSMAHDLFFDNCILDNLEGFCCTSEWAF